MGAAACQRDHARVEAYGAIDELNAALGLALAAAPGAPLDHWLKKVQEHLFHLGSDLATPLECQVRLGRPHRPKSQSLGSEDAIDQMTAELEPLRNFILPGGTPALRRNCTSLVPSVAAPNAEP